MMIARWPRGDLRTAVLTGALLTSLCVACSGVGAAAERAETGAPSDKAFIEDAIKGDNAEVQLGKLASERGVSTDVKNFGAMLAADHGQAKLKAIDVARGLGVQPTDAIPEEAKAEMDRLSALSGEKFDAEFARFMVKDHEKEIAKFKAKSGAKPGAKSGAGTSDVSTLAANSLPVLEKHLNVAKSIADKSGSAATGASSGEGKSEDRK